MKHALLNEIWQVRDKLSAECGHNVTRLAALVREEEAKHPKRLVRMPKQRAKGKKAA